MVLQDEGLGVFDWGIFDWGLLPGVDNPSPDPVNRKPTTGNWKPTTGNWKPTTGNWKPSPIKTPPQESHLHRPDRILNAQTTMPCPVRVAPSLYMRRANSSVRVLTHTRCAGPSGDMTIRCPSRSSTRSSSSRISTSPMRWYSSTVIGRVGAVTTRPTSPVGSLLRSQDGRGALWEDANKEASGQRPIIPVSTIRVSTIKVQDARQDRQRTKPESPSARRLWGMCDI